MNKNTKKMVALGLLTAIVVVLQFVSMWIRTATFSITLSLVPIVVGAALYGKWSGAWLGGVFGLSVLLTGDANLFLAINPVGTVITVLVKGILAGFVVGLIYELIKKKSDVAATYVSGILAPIVNTGIFIVGCYLFFLNTIKDGAGSGSTFKYIIITFVGFNFLIELAVNLVLSPTIVRIVKIIRKENK
ncbi:MAG: ECF transporter S component [Eubacterium sp.]|nr:ECF transporter S component [Eubacterium sp.]